MSRDWTREELNAASEMMKQNGHMGFEEFRHALARNQPVSFDLREKDRKELVKAISEILGEKAEYMRMPTCAYRIGGYTVAKDGTLTWGADVTDAGILLQALTTRGWDYAIVIDTAVTEETQPEYPSTDEEMPDADTYDFCIELPEEALTDAARANLDRIIESKGNLLRKALGTDTLVYEITDGKIRFPWFHISDSPEEVTAYTQLITALLEMAKNSKRITARERPVDNEKYAFRCFLLRLGFIGDAYEENINTMDSKGEVLLTIMASLAQQESESLSANVRMGIQFRNQQGKVQVNHNWFLGYTKDADGNLVIEPEQAEIVRRIYREYLEGASFLQIKRSLEADGIPNGAGHLKWHESNIHQILTNEKYIWQFCWMPFLVSFILNNKDESLL